MESFYRRSPLVFPSGVVAGFDPTHIGATNTRFSGVAGGSNFRSLLSGRVAAVTGTLTSTIDSHIGLCTNYSGTTAGSRWTLSPTVADNLATFACMVRMDAVVAGEFFESSDTGTSAGWAFEYSSGVRLTASGVANIGSALTLVAGTPYFVAVSTNAALNVTNFLVLNLRSGQISTQATTSATSTAPNGTYTINPNATTGNTNLSAIMFAAQYMSMAALKKWAQAPWDFWYPQPEENWVGAVVAAGYVPYNPWPLAAPVLAQ